MKPLIAAVFLLGAIGLGRASTSDHAIVAAMKLSEHSNYSWVSTVSDDAQTYRVEGKIEVGGYAWVRQPVPRTLARRLGRDAEPEVEAYFRDGTAVVWTSEGWRALDELPRCHEDWIEDGEFVVRGSGAPSVWNPTDPYSLSTVVPALILRGPKKQVRLYSNQQFGLCAPHEELGVMVSTSTQWEVRDNIVFGVLSDVGAQLLLIRDDQSGVTPLVAAGMFELTIEEGLVSRYDVRLEGIVEVRRKKIHVRQFSRTIVKHAGATRLEVPDEVRMKFEL